MAMTTALWSFALVVGLLTLTPGLDTALILRTAALGRRRRARGVVLGIQTGTLVWGAGASLGVTALLTASRLAYEVLRWAGVAYLVWMAARMVRGSFRDSQDTPARSARSARSARGAESARSADGRAALPAEGADSLAAGWRQGTLTNLLNPKVGVFYVAVLPQFIPAGAPHLATGLLMTGLHIAFGLLWSAVLIASAAALGARLRRPRVRRLLDRITGTVVAAFAVRLAFGD